MKGVIPSAKAGDWKLDCCFTDRLLLVILTLLGPYKIKCGVCAIQWS